MELPFNTLAALWEKDDTERKTRDHFENELREIFEQKNLKGRFLVVVAQNWAVGASSFYDGDRGEL